jgi:hypothetical protein
MERTEAAGPARGPYIVAWLRVLSRLHRAHTTRGIAVDKPFPS